VFVLILALLNLHIVCVELRIEANNLLPKR